MMIIKMQAEFVTYHTSINPALYQTLATLFLVVGLLFVAYFFVYVYTVKTQLTIYFINGDPRYEITSSAESSRRKRNLTKEISIAFPASLFLGFGSLFLLLWTNVYV